MNNSRNMSTRKSPRLETKPKKVFVDHDEESNDTSDESFSDFEDSSEENEPPRKKKAITIENNFPQDEEISEYEKERLKAMAENEARLDALGLLEAKNDLMKSINISKPKRYLYPKVDLPPREPSLRIRNKIENKKFNNDNSFEDPENEFKKLQRTEDIDTRILDNFDLEKEETQIFDNMNTSVRYDKDVDLCKCDQNTFQEQISTLSLRDVKKVCDSRIYSMFIHPCTSKILIIAGSLKGSLGVWDPFSESVSQFSYQTGPVNCLSASKNDFSKIYSTSHDGTLKCINIELNKVETIYATSFKDKVKHITWHDELDSNTIFFSHGNGSVGIVDLREDKRPSVWAKCYEKSCRTVHIHPCNENYFLTSSSSGYATVFDKRSISDRMDPISDMEHIKGLTSAFFSFDGKKVLTTCNDDQIKIFNTSELVLEPNVLRYVTHNNHTGQWLSVFKANWYPQRDDAFLVGSLMNPRRIQIYSHNGRILRDLKDENMTTISSIVSVHPTLPIITGGTSTGKIHTFMPPELAKTYESGKEP